MISRYSASFGRTCDAAERLRATSSARRPLAVRGVTLLVHGNLARLVIRQLQPRQQGRNRRALSADLTNQRVNDLLAHAALRHHRVPELAPRILKHRQYVSRLARLLQTSHLVGTQHILRRNRRPQGLTGILQRLRGLDGGHWHASWALEAAT